MLLNNKIMFHVMFAVATVMYRIEGEPHFGGYYVQQRQNQRPRHSHSHESNWRPPPPMKGLPQKVQIVRIDRASQRAGLVMPQQKFQMQVVQKVQTTVASRAKQSAVIGTQRPMTMTMEILIQRQNSLKTKIKTMLMQQNVTCEQNLDKDTFAAMENMIKISNVKICEWLRQMLTITLNNYILRYYILSNEVSPCSISLPDDLDKEYHILTKECRKIKNSAVGTISKLKNAEKTFYYKIVKDLLGQLKKKICALMGDDGDVSEAATGATTPTTTTVQVQTSKIVKVVKQRAQGGGQFFTFAGQGFSMLPPEMLPTTTEDSTTVDQSKSVKNIDKVKKKRTIAVEEKSTQTSAATTSTKIKTSMATSPTTTSTEKMVKTSTATSSTVKTTSATTTSTSATTTMGNVETSGIMTQAGQKTFSTASIATTQELETTTAPDMAKINEQQKALLIQIKIFIADNRARMKCDEKLDTEMISMMNDLFEQQSQEAVPSEKNRLIIKIILYHQLLKYYKSVINASEDRATMPKQLQERLKMESEKFKCLEKDKILDKSTMNESDQQIFDTINIYVFEIMKKKITTIKKTTSVSNSGKIRIRISLQ